jgi:hypothetical protein
MENVNDILKQFFDLLSYIFRHVIPGIIIILLAFLYFPFIFVDFDPKESYHVIFLGIIAISIGNLMYAFHRFTLHQLLDITYHLFYSSSFERESAPNFFNRLRMNFINYFEWMSNHTFNYYKHEKTNKDLFSLTHNKSAQLITLFITFETIIIFDFFRNYLRGCNNINLCYQELFPKILCIAWVGLVYCCIVCFIPWIMNVKFIKKL